jgi:tripartite-type tricarboxylate transporter receptor subunit TctC
MKAFRLFTLLITAALAAWLPRQAVAQGWPTRPITMMVAFAAGGSTDGVARLIATELGAKLGENLVVENKPGAGGNVAAQTVARAAPDGYTLLFLTSGPASINKLIYRSLAYDPVRDFSPIVLIGIIPQVVVTSAKLPVKTLAELVAYAKAHPGKLNFGNSGIGTTSHITAVLFARETAIDVTHVNYRGTAPLVTDLLGAQIEVGFPSYFPQMSTMNALAVSTLDRMEALPHVPTIQETGLADIASGVWFGIVAPAGTPADIVLRVNRIVNDFLNSETIRQAALPLGMRTIGGTPAEMQAYMARETARWAPVVEAAHIMAE